MEQHRVRVVDSATASVHGRRWTSADAEAAEASPDAPGAGPTSSGPHGAPQSRPERARPCALSRLPSQFLVSCHCQSQIGLPFYRLDAACIMSLQHD